MQQESPVAGELQQGIMAGTAMGNLYLNAQKAKIQNAQAKQDLQHSAVSNALNEQLDQLKVKSESPGGQEYGAKQAATELTNQQVRQMGLDNFTKQLLMPQLLQSNLLKVTQQQSDIDKTNQETNLIGKQADYWGGTKQDIGASVVQKNSSTAAENTAKANVSIPATADYREAQANQANAKAGNLQAQTANPKTPFSRAMGPTAKSPTDLAVQSLLIDAGNPNDPMAAQKQQAAIRLMMRQQATGDNAMMMDNADGAMQQRAADLKTATDSPTFQKLIAGGLNAINQQQQAGSTPAIVPGQSPGQMPPAPVNPQAAPGGPTAPMQTGPAPAAMQPQGQMQVQQPHPLEPLKQHILSQTGGQAPWRTQAAPGAQPTQQGGQAAPQPQGAPIIATGDVSAYKLLPPGTPYIYNGQQYVKKAQAAPTSQPSQTQAASSP